MRRLLYLALMAVSSGALGQYLPRGGSDEWSMHLLAIVGSDTYAFDGGATARNDGGAGIGVSVARNLNSYFAIGLEATLSELNYRASVAPGTGNAGAGFETRGDMESLALRAHATWNLLSRPLTPFLSATAGVIFLDPDISGDPQANGCWVYPWHGQVCSDQAPHNTLTRFTYGAGAGLRYELPARQGFVRAYFGGEWIQLSEASSAVGYVIIRADFGLAF